MWCQIPAPHSAHSLSRVTSCSRHGGGRYQNWVTLGSSAPPLPGGAQSTVLPKDGLVRPISRRPSKGGGAEDAAPHPGAPSCAPPPKGGPMLAARQRPLPDLGDSGGRAPPGGELPPGGALPTGSCTEGLVRPDTRLRLRLRLIWRGRLQLCEHPPSTSTLDFYLRPPPSNPAPNPTHDLHSRDGHPARLL